MTEQSSLLPKGFEELKPFLNKWATATSAERLAARVTSSMEEIREFYDAVLPRADEAMTLIDEYSLDNLPEDVARLCQLVLGLCQAAMAVEVHNNPRVPNTPFPNGISLLKGTAPFG